MNRSRVIAVGIPQEAPQPAKGAPEAQERPERYVSARERFMQEFYRQRAGARKLRQDGKCDRMSRPQCYDTCEFSAYCSEWSHTVRPLF